MNISDVIESFIGEMFSSDGSVELKRNELAANIGCVPSQINYVLQTRFTTERGYIVESRRGGGGYIKITKVQMGANEYIHHIINSLGDRVDIGTAQAIVSSLLSNGIIDEKNAKVILASVSDNALRTVISNGDARNVLRAVIIKNILINLV